MHLNQCYVAKKLMEEKQPLELISLGNLINSEYLEYAPVVTSDGNTLYFTSRKPRKDGSNLDIVDISVNQYVEDIYVSKKDVEGNWSKPVLIDFCEPQRVEATISLNSDQSKLYVYIGEEDAGNIYTYNFSGRKKDKLKKVDIPGLNTEYWETHIHESSDGKTLYFVSDRPGGYGGRDIYETHKISDTSWSEPINLGPNINSSNEEDSPYIAADNKTLYFSSNGANSMGGFDVFVSKKDEYGNWQKPINLGYPINSVGHDVYYTSTSDSLSRYISSFRKGGHGEMDIYEIRNKQIELSYIVGLKGKIETTSGEPLPLDVHYTLKCLDCDEDFEMTYYPDFTDGQFYSRIEACKRYEFKIFYKDNQSAYSEVFTTECVEEYVEVS